MQGDRRPELDPDQVLRNVQQGWASIRRRLPGGSGPVLILAVISVIAVLWMGTGFYTVGPTEQTALRLFGEFRGIEGPGLHWYPPSPMGSRDTEAVLETKTMELGFRANGLDVPVEAQMITGDLNIVDVQLAVQYRIVDLGKFLFQVSDPGDPDRDARQGRPDGRTLKDATESALRQVVGQRGIDAPLIDDKSGVQESTKLLLQQILDEYQTGIEVQQVVLQRVRPPDPVRDAFDDVVRARVDKESRINEANAYEQEQVPVAKGQAQQTIQAASAFKEARVAQAKGEASKFLSVLNEYNKSKDVTRRRLYLEAMEKILPGITIFIVEQDQASNLLPFLPLTPLQSSSGGVN
jgi:membrane protease subunit HflK